MEGGMEGGREREREREPQVMRIVRRADPERNVTRYIYDIE
jgi:hypothetical protein